MRKCYGFAAVVAVKDEHPKWAAIVKASGVKRD